jgi:hypothetical protein
MRFLVFISIALTCQASEPAILDSDESKDTETVKISTSTGIVVHASLNKRNGQSAVIVSDSSTIISDGLLTSIGTEGLLKARTNKCDARALFYGNCHGTEFFPQSKDLEKIFMQPELRFGDKTLLKCDPTISTVDLFQNSNLEQLVVDSNPYFSDGSCEQTPSAKIKFAKMLDSLQSKYSLEYQRFADPKLGLLSDPSFAMSRMSHLTFLLYSKYLEVPSKTFPPFRITCKQSPGKDDDGLDQSPPTLFFSESNFDMDRFEKIVQKTFNSFSSGIPISEKNTIVAEIIGTNKALSRIGTVTKAGEARISMAADSTSAITASGTQAIPTAPRVSVAQLVEAVKTNRPESQGVIQAFAQQAVREAREVVQQMPQESFKAIGGSSASFLAASQRVLAGDSRVVVVNNPTKPAATSPTAATNPKPPTSPVAPKINIGANVTAAASRTMASVVDDDDVEVRADSSAAASGKAGARGPASAATSVRGKASTDAGRANLGSTVDGVSFSGGGGGAGNSDPQGLQKKVSPSNSVSTTNPLVRDLMNKEKSREIVKSLKSADKAKKEEIEKRCKAGDARIFDKKNNILCQGKSSNPAIFREADDGSLIRLK